MSLTTEAKAQIVTKFQSSAADTGSVNVQVALLTAKISYLTEHLKEHKKDVHSRRGLVAVVNQRKSLIKYLKNRNFAAYTALIKELGIRK